MPFRPSLRLALVALSAPIVVAAQEHPDVTSVGNGARAVGLAFATTALANDIYAIGWNPAGLASLRRPEIAFTGRFLVFGTVAEGTDLRPGIFPNYSGKGEVTGTLDALEFAGIAVPVRLFGRTLTTGVAYRRFTEGVRVGTFETRYRVTNGRYFGSTETGSAGGMRAISPSIGVEITPRIRVGATANILSGSTTYNVRGPFPFKYETRELDYGGTALEVGTLIELRERLNLGIHTTLPHDRTFRWDNDTTIRDVTRKAPLALAVGLALALTPQSRVSADLRHAPWSTSEFVEDSTGDAVASSVGRNDAMSIHFGYERDLAREILNIYGVATGIRRTTQRLGVFARQSTEIDLKGKSIGAVGFSAGHGWQFERVSVDLGLMYLRGSQRVRSEDPELRMALQSNDLIVSFGIRRRF